MDLNYNTCIKHGMDMSKTDDLGALGRERTYSRIEKKNTGDFKVIIFI